LVHFQRAAAPRRRPSGENARVTHPSVCCLCGGFGGARFAPGLVESVGARHTALVTNPGDDLRFTALEVWPDFDSVLYAVSGEFDEELGWAGAPTRTRAWRRSETRVGLGWAIAILRSACSVGRGWRTVSTAATWPGVAARPSV
jgi:hypothetical protein